MLPKKFTTLALLVIAGLAAQSECVPANYEAHTPCEVDYYSPTNWEQNLVSAVTVAEPVCPVEVSEYWWQLDRGEDVEFFVGLVAPDYTSMTWYENGNNFNELYVVSQFEQSCSYEQYYTLQSPYLVDWIENTANPETYDEVLYNGDYRAGMCAEPAGNYTTGWERFYINIWLSDVTYYQGSWVPLGECCSIGQAEVVLPFEVEESGPPGGGGGPPERRTRDNPTATKRGG